MAITGNTTQPTWNDVLDLLSRELHISKAEIHDDEMFSDLGVDAILVRSIASSLSKLLGYNVPDAVILDCASIGTFHTYVAKQLSRQSEKASGISKTILFNTRDAVTSTLETNSKSKFTKSTKSTKSSPSASLRLKRSTKRRTEIPLSIILQGNPETSTETIFLLPDGSGSAMAYAGIPRITPTTCVIGLNSPFLGNAEEYNCTIEETSSKWIPEICARQPHGPYILGGWSAGGYYSFEVAKQLMAQGETVSKIVLLDSPCRTDFEALPMEVVRYLSSTGRMGTWGSGKVDNTPEWVTAHFDGTLRGVRRYMPTPLRVPSGLPIPQVFIIWCREGVWTTAPHNESEDHGLDLSVKVSCFLLKDKGAPATHGWEKLFPGAELHVTTMPGNHFTVISPAFVGSLSCFLRDVVLLRKSQDKKENWVVFS